MQRMPGFGLRWRLVALGLMGMIPAGAVLVHGAFAARAEAVERARGELHRAAAAAADDQKQVLDATARLLRALVESEVVRRGSPEECSRFLGGFLRQDPVYANLGIVREDGSFRASVLPIPPGVMAVDRSWFCRALATGGYVVGEHQIGRITRRPSINAALPFEGAEGGREVIFAALDLARLQERAAAVVLPEAAVLEAFDAKGVLLVSSPAPAGGRGGPLLFGTAAVAIDAGTSAAHVRVGLPLEAVAGPADRALRRSLLLLALVSAVALGGAFLFGHLLVVRHVRSLEQATERVGSGDLSGRFGPPYPEDEVGRLERAIDGMAATLQREQAARSAVAGDLRSSEELFGQMAEAIEEVFWVAAPGTRAVTYVSPAFEKVWGIPPRRLYEKPSLWTESIHPSDLDRAAAARAGEGGRYDETYRIVRPDGSVRWIRDRAFPVQDAAGAVVRVFGIAEDVTRFRDLELQVQQSQKMEAVGRLASGVAHDFNNVLTVIQGYTQLAAEHADEGSRKHLDEVVKAAHQAEEMTRQLLTFSRRQPSNPVPLDLNAALEDMNRMIRRLIGAPIEVVWIPGRDLPAIQADPSQVQQVVINLAVNARDAMPGGGRLTLETYGVLVDESYSRGHLQSKPGPYVVLAVTDTGVGIEESVRDKIFDPFFTTKPEGKGTGLGLATVYGIVQQCGGDIFVYSEPGVGTTFKIYLPTLERALAAAAPPPEERAIPPDPRTILLVEDDTSIRNLVLSVLQDAGHTVLATASGEDALRELAGHAGPLDLLLSDVGLPGIDGVALANQVHRMRPGARVLLASGYTEATAAGGAGIPPWSDFIAKPFGPPALLEKLAEIFGPGKPPPAPPPVAVCHHSRLERKGIQEGSEPGRRLYLLACLACGSTVSTEGLREERGAKMEGRVP